MLVVLAIKLGCATFLLAVDTLGRTDPQTKVRKLGFVHLGIKEGTAMYSAHAPSCRLFSLFTSKVMLVIAFGPFCMHSNAQGCGQRPRSEERRVGKECRSRW